MIELGSGLGLGLGFRFRVRSETKSVITKSQILIQPPRFLRENFRMHVRTKSPNMHRCILPKVARGLNAYRSFCDYRTSENFDILNRFSDLDNSIKILDSFKEKSIIFFRT